MPVANGSGTVYSCRLLPVIFFRYALVISCPRSGNALVGTCRMGLASDPDAVVAPDTLQVRDVGHVSTVHRSPDTSHSEALLLADRAGLRPDWSAAVFLSSLQSRRCYHELQL